MANSGLDLPAAPCAGSLAADLHANEHLAGVAHELRNCLGIVRNVARLMAATPPASPKFTTLTATFDRQAEQMARVINDLLDASRLTEGGLQLRRQRVDLRVVVGDAVASIEPDISQRCHRLAVALPDMPLWLEVDPGRLQQVIVNLLINAAKYTEPGGDMHLSLARQKGWAVTRIVDSGIGIAPDMLPWVFRPFVQAKRSVRHSENGIGLGLAVARTLVEQHGGRITAASAGMGKGSEFAVYLPIPNV